LQLIAALSLNQLLKMKLVEHCQLAANQPLHSMICLNQLKEANQDMIEPIAVLACLK
jgi:hypothetical protein